jgi:hypothetical protein
MRVSAHLIYVNAQRRRPILSMRDGAYLVLRVSTLPVNARQRLSHLCQMRNGARLVLRVSALLVNARQRLIFVYAQERSVHLRFSSMHDGAHLFLVLSTSMCVGARLVHTYAQRHPSYLCLVYVCA